MGALALRLLPRINLLRGFRLAQDDGTLARQALRGNLQAQDELIRRFYTQVYRVAYGILCEHHGALDVAQNLFARLRRVLRRYDGRSALRSYLYRAAVNASLDELRRRRRRAASQLPGLLSAPPDGAGKALEAAEVVRMALSELPSRQRAAVVLRDIQGLNTDEAADALGITPSGFRTLLGEGRLRLKEVIEKRFPEFADWS